MEFKTSAASSVDGEVDGWPADDFTRLTGMFLT